MSGHKRAMITLSEADLRKLAQIEDRLRIVETDYEEILRKSRIEREHSFIQGIKDLEERQNELISKLEIVDQELADIEFEASQNIYEFIENIHHQLGNQINERVNQIGNNLWSDITNFIHQYQYQYYEITANNIEKLQKKLSALEDRLIVDQSNKRDVVIKVIQGSEILIDNLLQNKRILDLFHEELFIIKIKLDYAHQNIQIGFLEAALSIAQECYLELTQICRRYDNYQVNHITLLSFVKERAVQVLERCKKLRFIPAIDLNGNELPIKVNLDEWSEGLYSHILKKLTEIIDCLDKDQIQDEKELLRINDEILTDLENQLDKLIQTARYEILASQIRFNIAECVIQALIEQGFQLELGAYKDQNPKKEYEALLRHIDGSEVVIQISPEDSLLGINRIDIHSLDAEFRTERELRNRANEIAKSLEFFGLRIGHNNSFIPDKLEGKPFHFLVEENIEKERVNFYGRN